MPSAILAQLVVLLVISVIIRVSVMGVDQSFTGNWPLSLDGRSLTTRKFTIRKWIDLSGF